jgi:hypothetical protein
MSIVLCKRMFHMIIEHVLEKWHAGNKDLLTCMKDNREQEGIQ